MIFCKISTVIPGRRGWSAIAPAWFRCTPVISISVVPVRRHISVEAFLVWVPHWRGRWRRWKVIIKITGWWWWVVTEVIWSRGVLVISSHPGTQKSHTVSYHKDCPNRCKNVSGPQNLIEWKNYTRNNIQIQLRHDAYCGCYRSAFLSFFHRPGCPDPEASAYLRTSYSILMHKPKTLLRFCLMRAACQSNKTFMWLDKTQTRPDNIKIVRSVSWPPNFSCAHFNVDQQQLLFELICTEFSTLGVWCLKCLTHCLIFRLYYTDLGGVLILQPHTNRPVTNTDKVLKKTVCVYVYAVLCL